MSNEEIVTTTTIVYDVRGIDKSIRSSQSLLFTVNAVRLGMEDFKRLGEDPSFSNFLWTGIQLTRIWTNLLRLVKRTNQAQRVGLLQGGAGRGGATRGGSVATSLALKNLFGEPLGFRETLAAQGLGAALRGFAAANPVAVAGIVGAIAVTGAVASDVRRKRMEREWVKKQTETAIRLGETY